MMTIPQTKCPNCKQECTEHFFPPSDPIDYDKIVTEDGRRIGYKYINNGCRINPYLDGGTQLICKNCCLTTFYPRSPPEDST